MGGTRPAFGRRTSGHCACSQFGTVAARWWWTQQWRSFKFILRELSSLAVIYFVAVLLWLIWALGDGPAGYAAFLDWMKTGKPSTTWISPHTDARRFCPSPKRKRGAQLEPSLALRASFSGNECDSISGRVYQN